MYIQVLVNRSNKKLNKCFTYLVPKELENKISFGKRVVVPFGKGNNKIEGYILSILKEKEVDFEFEIKQIIDVIDDFSLITNEQYDLAKYISVRYMCNFVDALNLIAPSFVRKLKRKSFVDKYIVLNKDVDEVLKFINNNKSNKTKNNQCRVLEYLLNINMQIIDILLEETCVNKSTLLTLKKKEYIRIEERDKPAYIYTSKNKNIENIYLNDEQNDVYINIKKMMLKEKFDEVLIDGVTGSGKTEIYIKLANDLLKENKGIIILVPEISLTPQMVKMFDKRIDGEISVIHSRLSKSEKYNQWERIKNGHSKVVIGARSAIFAPIKNLGLIIIDEENESTYKSDVKLKYDAKQVAKYICQREECLLIYGSATPSIDIYYRYKLGEVKKFNLFKRYNDYKLPNISIIDMKQELIKGNKSIFSVDVYEKIKDRIDKNQKVIIFINRRGHSSFVSCRSCGYVMKCSKCDVPYTYHFKENELECHHCGEKIYNPNVCPECGSKYIKYFGIGTQRIENSLKKLFPNVNILRMDKDTTSNKDSHIKILEEFSKEGASILIGTQMVIKGHDFKNVTLAVAIAVDAGLNFSDYRAGEKTYQSLVQLAGRVGRTTESGEMIIQTYNPENYILQCVKDYDYKKFYNMEILYRKTIDFYPFTNIFMLLVSCENQTNVIKYSNLLVDIINKFNLKNEFVVLGPARATIKRMNNRYRFKIIIKGKDEDRLRKFVSYCIKQLEDMRQKNKIYIAYDINPLYNI